LPLGHEAQEAELDTLENIPAAHGAQMRFAVRLGLDSTFAPAAQTACSVQNVFPSSLWNSVGPQATQLSAFDSPEYCPVGHCKHRSGVLLVVSESYSPGTQLIFTLQNGWPLSN
jgi:hypothetical protein